MTATAAGFGRQTVKLCARGVWVYPLCTCVCNRHVVVLRLGMQQCVPTQAMPGKRPVHHCKPVFKVQCTTASAKNHCAQPVCVMGLFLPPQSQHFLLF
jgi:hypothetical protein